MYARVFRGLLVISGPLKLKYEHVLKSSVQMSHPLVQNAVKCSGSGHLHVRQCSDVPVLKKDAVAQERIDEYIKDPENEKQWKVLQLEVEIGRQSGELIPEEIKPRHWWELLMLNGGTRRKRYLEFLFKLEKKAENVERKKALARAEIEKIRSARSRVNISEEEWLEHRLGRNSPFLRFYDSTLNHLYHWRLLRAMMDGPKVVMDCGYEDKMTRREVRLTAKQLMFAFSENRQHVEPFDLHLCNLDPDGELSEHLVGYIPTLYEPHFPINVTGKSYLELFDKDRLVYMTPDCNNELVEYDHDAVYIIGAIVDKITGNPVSMAKAKREGLKMAKLPINRYLHLGAGGHKNLTLNQMVSILLDLKLTGDWNKALRHIPRRKLFANIERKKEQKIYEFWAENKEQAEIFSSSTPQDFSLKGRKKFRMK